MVSGLRGESRRSIFRTEGEGLIDHAVDLIGLGDDPGGADFDHRSFGRGVILDHRPTTRGSGQRRRISNVASTPYIRSMVTPRTTTSGRTRCTAAIVSNEATRYSSSLDFV